MAKVRIGFSTHFEVENELVGIGTDNPTNTLQALGNIKSSDAKAIGVSTLTTFDGFTDTKLSLQGSAGAKQGTTSGEIIIEGNVTVSSGTTFTSGPENLTVTDNFTLPGISDDRPTVGTTRFNENLAALEFYTGSEWRAVNSYVDMGSRGRAVRAIGQSDVGSKQTTIDCFEIATTGNATYFGESSSSRYYGCSMGSNGTRGLFGGGSDVIDYVTIAAEGNAIDFGNLSASLQILAGTSSQTRGFKFGGYSINNVIEYVNISTIGNAIDFGDLPLGIDAMGACSSPTRGIICAGRTEGPENPLNMIDYITMASSGNAVDFGLYTQRADELVGCSNNVRGVFGGRKSPALGTSYNYLTIASTGNAEYFGDLTFAKREMGAASSQTRGTFFGGINPDSSVRYNTIEYVTFSTTGNGLDFGDLTERARIPSGVSDSHGGLGGF